MMEGGASSRGVPPNIFSDAHPDGAVRAASVWDLSHLLPLPAADWSCFLCGGALVVKDWKFHKRMSTGSASPWRCDVRLKCMTCGLVPMFGVLVSEAMWLRAERAFGRSHGSWIHWREGRRLMLEEADDGA